MAVEGAIVHYTAGNQASGTIKWFQMQESRASAHFVIDREGAITQMVDLDKAAWHAGRGEITYRGKPTQRVNSCTLGFELCNHGLLIQGDDGQFYYEVGRELKLYRQKTQPKQAILRFSPTHEVVGWWEPYSDAQIASFTKLLLRLKENGFDRAVAHLLGHEEIAVPVGRKTDPGPLFPWELFGRKTGRKTESLVVT
jgi:N-acetylmuramoyl-L-alanine amidase